MVHIQIYGHIPSSFILGKDFFSALVIERPLFHVHIILADRSHVLVKYELQVFSCFSSQNVIHLHTHIH